MKVQNIRQTNNPQTSDSSFVEAIKTASIEAFHEMSKGAGFRKIMEGKITEKEYKSILREIYFQTRETPPMMGTMTGHMRGRQREATKILFRHACAEMGHDQIALQDLRVLGEDTDQTERAYPLPETAALIGYAYHQIQHRDPAGFVGFIYFLEFIPSISGAAYMEKLESAGIPRSAMCFIEEHSTVDPAHVKLLDKYVEHIVTNEDHLEEVIYGIRCTAKLYGRMIDSAIESAADRAVPQVDPTESNERMN